MGKAVLIMILLLAVIVVIATVTLSVERKVDVIPEKIAEKEVRSDLMNLGAYALKWAIRQVHNEQITESNSSIFDDESGSYHFAFFEVPALDGSIDIITYKFGELQYVEGGGGEGDETDSTAQVDITALVSEDEYGNENDYTSFATILVSYSGEEEEEETPALSMEADLNINPTNNSSKRFQMQTPSGQIDRATLLSNGSSYTYSGAATEIRLQPKSGGNTITVNGSDITLSTSTAYTITSDSMTVNLRNSHGTGNAMGHWWIEITCTDPTVSPDPGLPKPEPEEEESVEAELESIEILYWRP